MEVHQSIRKIFRLYIGKHFTRVGRAVFGKWLRAEQFHEEKEAVLQEYWLETRAEITSATWHDWNRLRDGMGLMLERKKPVRTEWLKYAAVAALLILTAGGTYWFTNTYTLRSSTEMAEMFVPYGETREIVLPDSSRVWVNAGSTLLYPSDFKKMNSRTVYLTGEASFRVQKNKEKPFIVKTLGLDVQALGTVFTVKSYAGERYTTATLEEGCVKVSLKENSGRSYILKPSEQLIYSHDDYSVRMNQVDLSAYKMLRKGYLIFENVSFQEMVSTLEKKYGVTFQYNATQYGNELYNVKFAPTESIEDVMEILRQLIGIQYIIKEKHIILK